MVDHDRPHRLRCGHRNPRVPADALACVVAMSAQLLREAAASIRQRAEAATPGPWYPLAHQYECIGDSPVSLNPEGDDFETASMDYEPNRRHIASWHPAVALAVADWLDVESGKWDAEAERYPSFAAINHAAAFAVARVYLGRSS